MFGVRFLQGRDTRSSWRKRRLITTGQKGRAMEDKEDKDKKKVEGEEPKEQPVAQKRLVGGHRVVTLSDQGREVVDFPGVAESDSSRHPVL